MSVYNSAAYEDPDDADITMINHSFLFDNNDVPMDKHLSIIRRAQEQCRVKNANAQDYIIIEQNPWEKLEIYLTNYRNKLKNDNGLAVDCHGQFIKELTDFISENSKSNENKRIELDTLRNDIDRLHHQRYCAQSDRNTESKIFKDYPITPINTNRTVDYSEWIEMEKEIDRLFQLVKSQQKQIDELISICHSIDGNQQNINSHSSEKRCCLCDDCFPATYNKTEMISHLKQCLSQIDENDVLYDKEYDCPSCNKKIKYNDDLVYLQHLTSCFNEPNSFTQYL